MCGADSPVAVCFTWNHGSPPRVRSRQAAVGSHARLLGITSACAEQTCRCCSMFCTVRDHLRVCGADFATPSGDPDVPGSPPRVRSRLRGILQRLNTLGITSACAEQTRHSCRPCPNIGDHLRVCGADPVLVMPFCTTPGSPPRVRSRLRNICDCQGYVGITSACAEQTAACTTMRVTTGDHLRVCGADSCILLCSEPAEWRGIFDLRTA